jgi:site-specific recombinase XerC
VSTSGSGPTVTCATCGVTGPGRAGLCRRCYARAQHTPRVCAGCNQLRRHLAAGRCARCYRLQRTRQQRCSVCDEVRPIYFGDRCERCKQRARQHLGRCQRCGQQAILSGRYCRACLEQAAERVGSCADCLCWTGLLGGRCKPCRLFGWHHELGDCPSCGRQVPLGAAGRCRLCLATSRVSGTIPSLRAGIQLFALVGTPTRRRPPEVELPPRPAAAVPGLGQLRLSRAAGAHPPARWGPRPEQRANPRLVNRVHQRRHAELDAALASYGQARGWSPDTLQRIRRSLVVLLASQPPLTLRSSLDAAAVRQFLIERRLTALRVVEFLVDQGLVTRDEHAPLDRWLAGRLEPLPAQLRAEVQTWTEVLRGRGPRPGRSRKPATVQGYLRALEPALADWSTRYQSLRQVTTEDVTAQLQRLTGPTRRLVLAVMRSLFKTLKARRVIFTNPTAGLELHREPPPPALGLDAARRASLLDQLHRPDRRLIVLLAGVHALRAHQIRVLALDDVDLAAGTLLVGGRSRRLDAFTRTELRAWLELRRARWPASANPYLLVNQSTAGGCTPVTRSWVQEVFQRLGVTAEELRVDRLLAEVQATGGDPLRLTRLFGIADTTAIRYCLELGPLDQAHHADQVVQPPLERSGEGHCQRQPTPTKTPGSATAPPGDVT